MLPSKFLSPRYRNWPHWGALTAALLGLAVGLHLDWYFFHGAGAANPDRGEAHGFIAVVLGFPFSLLPFGLVGEYVGRAGMVLSVAATWSVLGAVFGAVAALFVARVRNEDLWADPPAG